MQIGKGLCLKESGGIMKGFNFQKEDDLQEAILQMGRRKLIRRGKDKKWRLA